MLRSDTLRREIARLEGKGAELTKELARRESQAIKARATAARKRSDADRTKSDSSRRMALSSADSEERRAADATRTVSAIQKRIADNSSAVATKRSQLAAALASEQRTKDRDDERRRQTEKQHARELARISQPAIPIRYVSVQPPKPERLRVLYLTANPESIETTIEHADGSTETTGTWLRVDYEVRQVKDMLRKTKYRDLVRIDHFPAATTMDLLEGLNDLRPHVVHFSGHASSWGILMENDEGTIDGDGLDFALLARILGATDLPPRLAVLNACESLAGADDLLQTVPIVVAMSSSINDASAVVFAARFYYAIASAQSVGTALEQAKVAMKAASLDGSELPEVRARDGLDVNQLVLVRPTA